jgi:long-chain acyl-CoA synthetase
LLRNDLVFLEATQALNALGANAVPVNWHFASAEISYILSDCNARAVIVHSDLLPRVKDVVSSDIVLIEVPVAGADSSDERFSDQRPGDEARSEKVLQWQDIAVSGVVPELPDRMPNVIIYTSGTTGKPKGVVRKPASPEHATLTRKLREDVYGVVPGARALLPGPLYHSAPNSFGLLATRNAQLLVVMPRFEPEETLRLIEQHNIDTMIMVPTMFVRLLDLPEAVRSRYDLSSLRFVIHGAAPCATDVKRRMIDWFGPVINEFYGATEVGLFTLCASEDWLRKPGTVGQAVAGVDIKILDADNKTCAPGEHGEIYIRNPLFPDFTYHNREDDREDIERDGFISCGDIGYFDDEGFLFLCDRAKDMVISGGVNIYPAEIEAVLQNVDGVYDCAVFGVPDAEFGESLCAVIQPQPDTAMDAESVQAALRQQLASYKVPRRIEFSDDVPRDESGKLFKRKLRERYWLGQSTNI